MWREQEDEEGEKKARAELCTVQIQSWFGWEGCKEKNGKRAVSCFQHPMLGYFIEPIMLYGFFWKKCKRERGPGIQSLRSRVATLKKSVGLDLGSKRVTFAV